MAEKLKAEAETIAAEGWKWIEAAVDFPYGHDHHLRRLDGTPEGLTTEEQATLDALNAENARLEAEYASADELPDEVDQRIGEIETALAKFADRPLRFEPVDVARAGVFVSVDEDGCLRVDRGYVRPEDKAAAGDPEDGVGDPADADGAGGGHPGRARRASYRHHRRARGIARGRRRQRPRASARASHDGADRAPHARAARRGGEEPARRDDGASLPALPRYLPARRERRLPREPRSGMSSSPRRRRISRKAFPPGQSRNATRPGKPTLPKDTAALWDWLSALDEDRRAKLLAHCVSFGVNALHEKGDRQGGPGVSYEGLQRRIREADRLARAVGLDMVEAGWRPTAENYLGRVTKPRILDAVREARGEDSVRLIDHLKKADMAKEAERLLEGTGWLPEAAARRRLRRCPRCSRRG